MSIKNKDVNVCLICGASTSSIHNSVNSCRPCSAFFRRGLTRHQNFRCRRGNKKCVLKPGDKSFCKYCRFQRCKAVGMVIKGMTSKDGYRERSESPINFKVSEKPKTEHVQIISKKEASCEKKKISCKIDVNEIKSIVNNIFNSRIFFYNNDQYETCLQKVMNGIDKLNEDLGFIKQSNITIVRKFELRHYVEQWQKVILSSPNLLMNLEEFSSLSSNDKGIIFSHFWSNLATLITGNFSLKVYDPTSTSELLILLNGETMFNANDVEIVDSGMSKEATIEAYNFYKPLLIYYFERILKPMKIFSFEKIEIAYMVLQMIFSNEAFEKTSKNCQRIGECLLKVANDELHNYYIYNKKITNYAYRLSEMTKLLYTIKEHCDREKEVTLLAKWFDLFDLSFVAEV